MYAVAAQGKLWLWAVLRIDRWPEKLLPRIPNLRVLHGIELLANYRRLTEITRMLSATVDRGTRNYSKLSELSTVSGAAHSRGPASAIPT